MIVVNTGFVNTLATVYNVVDVAVDSTGTLYITEGINCQIHKISGAAGFRAAAVQYLHLLTGFMVQGLSPH
jgi:hypothetical protein